jgi:TorA maturation chaperone TorD
LALAEAFSPPATWSDEVTDQVLHAFGALDVVGAQLAEELRDELRRADRGELKVAHARLFLGPFEVQASPYASSYLEPDGGLMGPTSRRVAELYAAAGLGPGEGPREVPDHLLSELEFMYFLSFQEVAEGAEPWREQRRRFVSHVASWLPRMLELVLAAEVHRVYAALARLAGHVLRVELNSDGLGG